MSISQRSVLYNVLHCYQKPAKCRFHDGAYYTIHFIAVKTSKNADFRTGHIIKFTVFL